MEKDRTTIQKQQPSKEACQELSVQGLSVAIRSEGRDCPALTEVSFRAYPGEILGLVGESGCGKSITALALIGLLKTNAKVTGGQILLGEEDLLQKTEREMCAFRGEQVSMIFQDMSALNPLMTVGKQIAECYRMHHKKASAKQAKEKALEMMKKVGLSRVEELYREYPHQLSGGMKQRIVIAMALINHPRLIIADEPTTALDVTIQAQILELLQQLNKEFQSIILLISHNLGLVHSVCDNVMVMYGGRIVEQGETERILQNPKHPYTKGLLASIATAEKRGELLHCIPGVVEPLEKRTGVGCPFAQRCEEAVRVCRSECPELLQNEGRQVRCHLCRGTQDAE